MMKEELQKSAMPLYAAGLCWVLYAIFFPLYRWFDFLIAAALSVAVYFLFSMLFPGKKVLVPVKEKPVSTGDRELDDLLNIGKGYLENLRGANRVIEDKKLSAQMDRIEEVAGKIFNYVRENPKKASMIRRFMDYYLPTTVKLLNAYSKLQSQGVSGENITASMRKIEEMLGTIVSAFEKQLDSLFADEALDISTDITVMESMLAQEGLTGGDFGSAK